MSDTIGANEFVKGATKADYKVAFLMPQNSFGGTITLYRQLRQFERPSIDELKVELEGLFNGVPLGPVFPGANQGGVKINPRDFECGDVVAFLEEVEPKFIEELFVLREKIEVSRSRLEAVEDGNFGFDKKVEDEINQDPVVMAMVEGIETLKARVFNMEDDLERTKLELRAKRQKYRKPYLYVVAKEI